MGYKTLELTLISAKDLKNVSMIGKMDVYVVVTLSGDPGSKQKTPTHQDGGTNPCWNHTLRFNFDEATAAHAGWDVVFVLRHDAFGPDKDLGEVRVPVKDLVSGYQGKTGEPEFATYQVRSKSSGKGKGELKISYKIKDAPDHHHQKSGGYPPQGAYPAGYPAQAACSSGAANAYPAQGAYPPPPQQGTAYAYPAAPGYPPAPAGYPQAPYPGYPPQQPGYGYGYPPQGGYPVQAQKPKKSGGGFGMGLGAGLLGGAVGGLLLGEVIEDSFDGGDF